jgi:hypothetical protein
VIWALAEQWASGRMIAKAARDDAPDSPDGPPDAEQQAHVVRLRPLYPRWVVIWLPRLRCYRAYPHFRFRDGRRFVSATDPDGLTALMDEAERDNAPRGRAAAMRQARSAGASGSGVREPGP